MGFLMLTISSKNVTRRRVHKRIRKKVLGTAERPRLNVYRSLNNIYVQVIDDLQGVTLVSANSAEGKKGTRTTGGNLAAAAGRVRPSSRPACYPPMMGWKIDRYCCCFLPLTSA